MSGLLCEVFGRRTTLIIGNLLILATWVSMHFSDSFTGLFLSRVVMGAGTGIAMAASFVLIGEISTVNYRGALGNLNISARNLGALYIMVVGSITDYEYHILGEA